MDSPINLTSIIATNFLGCMTILVLLVNNRWRLKERSRENNLVLMICATVLVSCLADPFVFWADGKEGFWYRLIIIVGNTWLFFANVIANGLWIMLIATHLKTPQKQFSYFLRGFIGICGAAGLLLVVNLFVPLVFSVDEYNRYERKSLFWIFIAIALALMIFSLVFYYRIRRKSGRMKFFPFWSYLIPLMVGMLCQAFAYGVSLIWPCAAVATIGLMVGLQNEMIFRDKLTGVFSRYYLGNLNREWRGKEKTLAVMLADINGFKKINDSFGHDAGDVALVETANILQETVGLDGIIIRYGGDEFVIILNTDDYDVMNGTIYRIHKAFEKRNAEGEHPYKLSVAIGSGLYNFRDADMEQILKVVDNMMYDRKESYYQLHPEES